MRAIAVTERGDVDKLIQKDVPKPGNPEGYDVLVW